MAVYFVYRCDEMGPCDLYRRRFDDATLLDWFRRIWRPMADDEEAHLHGYDVLGVLTWNFGPLFVGIRDAGAPPPSTIRDVRDALQNLDFSQIRWEKHCIQMLE